MTDIDEQWRHPGRIVRARYITEDTLNLDLSPDCAVEDYLQGANETLEQLLEYPLDTHADLIRAYMLGHRLKNLLRDLLPRHPHFEGIHKSIVAEQMRIVNHYIEQIALLIDQHQYSKVQAKDTICSGDSDDSGIVENLRHLPETIQQTPTFSTIASPAASFDDESELSPIQPMQEDDGFISVQQSVFDDESFVFANRSSKDISNGDSSPKKSASALKYTARKPSRRHVMAPDTEPRSNDFPSVLSQAFENAKQALPASLAQGDSSTTANQSFTMNNKTERQSPRSEEVTSVKKSLNNTERSVLHSSVPNVSRIADCDPHPSADNIEIISYSGKKVMFETDRRVIDSVSYLAGEHKPNRARSLVDQDDSLEANDTPSLHRVTLREETLGSTESQQQVSNSNRFTTRPALLSLGNNLQSSKKKQSTESKSVYDDIREVDTRTENPWLSTILDEDDVEYDQNANSPRNSRTFVFCESQLDRPASPRLVHARSATAINETDNHPHLKRYGRRKELSLEEPEASSLSAPVITSNYPLAKVSSTRNTRESPGRLKVPQKTNSTVAAKGPRNHLNSTSRRRPVPQDVSMTDLIWDSPNESTQWSQELELAATFPVFEFSHRENQCQSTELDDIIRSIVEDATPVTRRDEKPKTVSASTMNDERVPSSPTFTHDGWSLPRNDIHGSLVKPRNIFPGFEEPSPRAGRRNHLYDRMKDQPTSVNSSTTSIYVDLGDLSPHQDTQGYLSSLDRLASVPVNEVKDKILSREDRITQERSRVLPSQLQRSPSFPWKQINENFPDAPESGLQDRTSQKSIAALGNKTHGLSAKPKYAPPSVNAFTSLVNTNHSLMECERSLNDNTATRNGVTTLKTVFTFCLTHR